MRSLLLALCLLPLPVVAQPYYRTFFHKHPPLKRIKPGEIVATKTLDSGGQDEKNVHRHEPGNPLTGPFYIEGAEAGDAIRIHFRKVRMNRNWGYTGYRLLLPSLTPEHANRVYSDRYKEGLVRKGRANIVPWDLDLEKNTVRLREPKTNAVKLEFPAKPMLGCVGVAAPGDWAPTSGPAGPYGGNLDYNEIGEGVTVILPVYHPGALLFVGDAHALQGDGEPTGTGIETSMDVEFSVELKKKTALSGPRVETATHIISIGAQPEFASSLDRALQMATTDMVQWLSTDYKMEEWAAHLLVGYQGKYDVITVAGSMALKIPKSVLPK